MPRDSQRQRLYDAETPLGGRRLPTLADCAASVDEVVGSLWWLDRFPQRHLGAVPRLRPGNGARQAFYREEPAGPTITLPRRYRTTGVVLHELAHWAMADADDLPDHGRTFARILLDLTTEFAGVERAARLAASYAHHRVHAGAPARRSPDGSWCYGWDERLRLGRGRLLELRWATGERAVGTLTSRAHRHATLTTTTGTVRVPEREIWSVRPAR